MKYQFLIAFFLFSTSAFCQISVSQIEGRLEVYLPTDSLSLHIGKNAGNSGGLSNTFVGSDAGSKNVACCNSFFGTKSGANNTGPTFNNPDGSANSFFGYYSGFKNTWGSGNSFFGSNSGTNSNRYGNSFFGAYSGNDNVLGYNNSFFGSNSGRKNLGYIIHPVTLDTVEIASNNTFLGARAGMENLTGEENTFIGAFAGNKNEGGALVDDNGGTYQFNKAGSRNVFIGYESGYSNKTGQENIYIGNKSSYDNMSGSHNITIGHYSGTKIQGSYNVIIGRGPIIKATSPDSVIHGRLYIGDYDTETPLIYGEFFNDIVRINGRLETENSTVFMRNLGNSDSNRGVKWGEKDDEVAIGIIYDGEGIKGDNRLHFREYIDDLSRGNTDLMTIKANGNVGIGVDNPDATLHIKDFAKLEPQAAPPDCTSTNHEGRVYFAQGTQKLRVCTSGGWINVH